MAVAYEGTTATEHDSSSGGTTQTITSPAGDTSDVLLLYVQTLGGSGSPAVLDIDSIAATGGVTFTKVDTEATSEISGNNRLWHWYSTQVTSSSALTVTFTLSRAIVDSTAERLRVWCVRYSGVTGVASAASNFGGNDSSITGGSLTIDAGNGSVLMAGNYYAGNFDYTAPGGYVERFDAFADSFSWGGFGAYDDLDAVGSVNPAATFGGFFDTYGGHYELAAVASSTAHELAGAVGLTTTLAASLTVAHPLDGVATLATATLAGALVSGRQLVGATGVTFATVGALIVPVVASGVLEDIVDVAVVDTRIEVSVL